MNQDRIRYELLRSNCCSRSCSQAIVHARSSATLVVFATFGVAICYLKGCNPPGVLLFTFNVNAFVFNHLSCCTRTQPFSTAIMGVGTRSSAKRAKVDADENIVVANPLHNPTIALNTTVSVTVVASIEAETQPKGKQPGGKRKRGHATPAEPLKGSATSLLSISTC